MSSAITFDTGLTTVNGVAETITASITVGGAVDSAASALLSAIDSLIVNGIPGQASAAVEGIIATATPSTINVPDPSVAGSGGTAGFTQQTYAYITGAPGSTINLPAYNPSSGAGFSGMIVDVAGVVTVNGGGFKAGRILLSAESDVTFDPQGGPASASTIIGGGGNNNLTLDSKNYTVLLSGGNNTVSADSYYGSTGTATFNTITTDAGNNVIRLNAGTDIVASAGTDSIYALANKADITVAGTGAFVVLNKAQSDSSITASGASQTINVNGTRDVVDAASIGASSFIYVNGQANSVAFGSASNTMAGAGGYVFVNGSANAVTLGAAGNVLVGKTGSNNTITGGAGAPVADFGTNDLVSMTGGLTYEYGTNSTITASNTARVYADGSGNVVSVTGSAVATGTVTGGVFYASGGTHLALGGKNAGDLVNLSGTATAGVNGDSVVTSGSNLIGVYSNANSVTVGGTGAALFTFGGSSTVTMTGSATLAIYENGGTADVQNGGTGTVVANQGAGSVTINAGAGSATLYGGTSGSNVLIGGSGGSNYLAASGNSTLEAGGGATTMVGAAGAESMMASTVAGSTNAFLFGTLASGSATISGFTATNSSIVLQDGLTVTGMTAGSGNQTLALSNGGSIELFGFSSQLNSATAAGGITTIT
jgi:hypothetical protein